VTEEGATLGAVSVVLQDTGALALKVDCWARGAFHAVVSVARILPEATWAPLRFNDGGALTAAEVLRRAAFVEAVMLPCLRAGERFMLEGTVARENAGRAFQADEAEAWRDYSLSLEALAGIRVHGAHTEGTRALAHTGSSRARIRGCRTG